MMKEWNDPWNPFNSAKVLLWKEHLERCAKEDYLPPVTVDIDPSNRCMYKCPHCLTEDAIITKVFGKNVNIKNIKDGDVLLGWNENSAKIEETIVRKVFQRETSRFLRITLYGGNEINVTEEHPFFVDNKWITARDLSVGTKLLLIPNNEKVKYRMRNHNPMCNPESVKKMVSNLSPAELNRRSAAIKKRHADGLMPHHIMTEKTRQANSKRMKENNPMFNAGTRERVGNTLRRRYEKGEIHINSTQCQKDAARERMTYRNPMFDEVSKQKRLDKIDYEEVIRKSYATMDKTPSKLEYRFYNLLPDDMKERVIWNYDFNRFIDIKRTNRKRVPDFYIKNCDGNVERVIEIGVTNQPGLRWNKSDEVIENMMLDYNSSGIECMFVSKKDLDEDNGAILEKTKEFVSVVANCPYTDIIVGIDKIEESVDVFNLECFPHNNYFANNILVHNCNAWKMINDSGADMTEEHMIKLVDFMADWRDSTRHKTPNSACIAGGGESFMNSNLVSLYDRMYHYGMEIGIITTGFIMREEHVEAIARTARWIGFSVDAATSKTYNKLKGLKQGDSFEKVKENIKRVVKRVRDTNSKCDVAFKFLLTPDNALEIYSAIKLAKELGVHDFHLRPAGWDNLPNVIRRPDYTGLVYKIDKQLVDGMKLESKDFHVYGVRHKFNPDFSRKVNFKRCWAIPMLPTFGADGNVHT